MNYTQDSFVEFYISRKNAALQHFFYVDLSYPAKYSLSY